MGKEKIETKKDEIRYTTSDPKKMLNRWLVKDVLQKWTENFLDKDTGEVVQIERWQKFFEKGKLIDQDTLSQIMFYIQAGSISEVEVSNQKRIAFERQNTHLYPWTAQVEIGDKKHKFLLYASSITNVVEILNDYIELNYSGGFQVVMAKEMDSCIILTDNLSKQKVYLEKAYLKDEIPMEEYAEAKAGADETEKVQEKKFYQLEVKVAYNDDTETTQSFIVHTHDTDRAMMIISAYLKKLEERMKKANEEKDLDYEEREFKLCIEKAAPVPIGAFVPKEFSMAYNPE